MMTINTERERKTEWEIRYTHTKEKSNEKQQNDKVI